MTITEVQGAGNHPPLFVFPGIPGVSESARAIADALGPDIPVYGLDRVRHGALYAADFQAEAEGYAEMLRAAGFRPPYHFLGHSYGAQAAYATAAHLQARGEEVAFLGIIDDDADVHRRRFGVISDTPDFTDPVSTAYHAADRNPLVRFGGRVTLFRAETWAGDRQPAPAMDWEYLAADGVDVFPVRAMHGDIVHQPALGGWIPALRAALAQARGAAPEAGAPRPAHFPSQAAATPEAFLSAFALSKQGDLEGEIAGYRAGIDEIGHVPEWVAINLSAALQQQGEDGAAIAVLRQAIRGADHITNAHISLAKLLRQLGRERMLARFSGGFAELEGASLEEWRMLGLFFQVSQRRGLAARATRAALRLDPRRSDCRRQLCRILVAQRRFDAARTVVKRGLHFEPGSVFLRQLLAEIHEAEGSADKAEAVLRRILADDEQAWRSNMMLCRLLRKQGREEEAWTLAVETLRRFPRHKGLRAFATSSPLHPEGEEIWRAFL